MRIGIFTDTYYPCINGVSASTLYYAQEFAKLGHHTFIFCPKYKNSKNELADFDKPGFSVLRCPAIPAPTNKEHSISFPVFGFGVNIKKLKLDIIHIQAPFIQGLYGNKMAKKLKIPLTQTYHTFWEQYSHYFILPEKWVKKWIIAENRYLCNRSMVNFIPSPQTEEILRRDYKVTTKMVQCPTGIDVDGFKRDINHKLVEDHIGIPKDKKILFFASRICKEKSADMLIHALPLVLKKVPEAVLVLSGEGPLLPELKRLIAEYKVEENVVIKGYMPRGDLYAYYKAADLFVFPSVSETQGIVVLEAQYFGTPVVGIKKMGVAMLLKNNIGGLLAEEQDVNEFANLIIKLLTDKALYDQKAKEAVENAMKWRTEVFAKLMEDEMLAAIESYKLTKG